MGSKLRSSWPPVAVVAGLLLAWQAAVKLLGIETWLLPAPLDIWQEAVNSRERLWLHTVATARLAFAGFAIGAVAGILIAAVLHLLPRARAAFAPLLIISQNVPTIVLGPLLIIWLGTGLAPKLVLIMLICFFPISVAMLTGLSQSDRRLVNYMAMVGAGKWRMFRSIELPHSLPYLFSGLRIAAAYSITGAVVAEWLGAHEGIGYYIRLSSHGFKAPSVFAGIAIIIALSLLMFGLVALLERRAIRWKPQREGEGR